MGQHLRLGTMFRGLCSECGAGRVFASRWRMNPTCPVCGTRFEREPGYFTGAMYFSYAMGIPAIALAIALGWWLTRWPLHWLCVIAWVTYLPLVPAVFRLSRVMFIHFDRFFDPEDEGESDSARTDPGGGR